MTTERVKPLAQVLADGYMTVTDNVMDFSGSIIHPKEGPGSYMAPLDSEDPKAMATRIHEYIHLQLITSGIQPTGLHAAFDMAGIENMFLQAMADAKVMTYAQSHDVSLKDLVVINQTDETAVARVKGATKARQANLLLRSIGTDLFDFAFTNVTLTDKQKKHIVGNVFPKIAGMKTLEDWVRIGLEYQRMFETPKVREKRKAKAKDFEEKEEETPESGGSMPSPKAKPRDSAKKDMEKFKDLSKKIVDKLKDEGKCKEKDETDYWDPKEESGRASKGGGTAASEEKLTKEEIAKKLEVYDKEKEERTEKEEMVKEVEENFEEMDKKILDQSDPKSLRRDLESRFADRTKWGTMEIIAPRLEKPFEPLERSKRAKRSYVGAFRYPHRLVSDSAVFASKQRGKGGTLVIDCSGSMHIHYKDVMQVLEQRPFATIALYASVRFGLGSGKLIVIVDRGKCVTETELSKLMSEHLGSGNVVDGPALDWLCKRAGEKFWVCDGIVTGVGDITTVMLQVYVIVKERRYKIKRWSSLQKFIDKRRPDHE